jgi:hypothetical protein
MSVSDPGPAVANAIINYTSGLESGEPGLVVGADVSAFEMAGAVARQLPGMYVKACSVAVVTKGSAAPIYPTGYVSEFIITPYEQAVLTVGDITVNEV